MATKLIRDLAYSALPHLVECARLKTTITYGELGVRIGRHHRVVPHVLGCLRDEVCTPRHLPLINVIVVNKHTRLPGESFLAPGTGHLSPEEYRARFEKEKERVFAFRQWDALLAELSIRPLAQGELEPRSGV